MKKLISAKEIEDLIRSGGSPASLPVDALYTPAARDLLRDLKMTTNGAPGGSATQAESSSDAERIFHSKEVQVLKDVICDIGRRLWTREYVDGNGGNVAVRVGENLVLCTPTLVSKGFMKPEDLCLVDLEGNQKAGVKKRTSEILTHLAIMKAQPKARAAVHCHPPYATGFAVAGIRPPSCMLPEIEIFIGEVPVADYRTPGTPEVGRLVAELAGQHNTILMGNHGAIAWSHSIEDAYFKMEILEAYCRTILVAGQLGVDLKTISREQMGDLFKIKQSLGIPDRRIGLKECELCDNSEWRPGVACAAQVDRDKTAATDPEAEAVVQAITDQIMEKLNA